MSLNYSCAYESESNEKPRLPSSSWYLRLCASVNVFLMSATWMSSRDYSRNIFRTHMCIHISEHFRSKSSTYSIVGESLQQTICLLPKFVSRLKFSNCLTSYLNFSL